MHDEGDERNRRMRGRKRKHRETGAENPEDGGSRKVKAGQGRAEVVNCRGETAEGERRLQAKLRSFSCVSWEGAKASLTTAK